MDDEPTENDLDDSVSETTGFLSASARRKISSSKDRRGKMTRTNVVPLGVRIVQRLCIPTVVNRMMWYRVYILVLTFCFYATYHLSRRPLGIVKNVLHQNCSGISPNDPRYDPLHNGTWCDWKPFDEDNYAKLFSYLDFTYWLAYAIGMFFVGHIAERTNLRNFLSIGMITAGFWTIIFGLAYFWEIHSYSYFVGVQIFAGVFQATGWPSVVTLVGNWFGKKRLGLIFGIWNSHTSVGNILGAVIAGEWVNGEWGLSFVVPGLIIIVAGILAYLFVVIKPEDVGLDPPDHVGDGLTPGAPTVQVSIKDPIDYNRVESSATINIVDIPVVDKPINFIGAVRIPGVIEFSICLFFAKAVSYTFLVCLPQIIRDTSHLDNSKSADLSAIFDAGGIVGGIIAGLISDSTGGSATVCGSMFVVAVPLLYLMLENAGQSVAVLITLLVVTGLFINGPYALITTAVSADLGTHPTLTGNSKALATVTAVIDGTGSLGAAFGPLAAGLIKDATNSWDKVFYMLIVAQVVALLCLTRLIFREVKGWVAHHRRFRGVRTVEVARTSL